MIGSYEGRVRECDKCGTYTNVHMDCDGCQTGICEECAVGDDAVYCSIACAQRSCLHNDIRVTVHDGGVCSETGYHDYIESAVCRDCGAEFDDEPAAPPARRMPATAAAIAVCEVA